MRTSFIPIIAFVTIIGALGYIFISEPSNNANRDSIKSKIKSMPNFRIQALVETSSGSMGIMSDTTIRATGKPTVVNFFASWCQPCLAEHPLLMEMALNNQIQVFGIAWNDNSEAIQAWIAKHGNPFFLVGIDNESIAGIEWGIAGIPETFFLDKKGNVQFVHIGPLSRETMQNGLQAIKATTPENP